MNFVINYCFEFLLSSGN